MKYMKGSFTVEASLVMGIILSVLVGMIYLGFFLHDRGFVQAASHEAACSASLHSGDAEKPAAGNAARLVQGRMLGTRGLMTDVSEGKKTVTVHMSGQFRIPSMAAVFYGMNQIGIESRVVLTTRRPSELIWKARQVKRIAEQIRGQ